jgi:hypothetical protein
MGMKADKESFWFSESNIFKLIQPKPDITYPDIASQNQILSSTYFSV